MRRITAFNFVSLDGYYKDAHNDISWHQHGGEESEYSADSLKADNILLFGRITYEMMKSYWPTDMAKANDPVVAAGMNNAEKIVFSNSLTVADWQNTSLISGDIVEAVRTLKQSRGKDMAILGSGSIITQFAAAGLIDEFQIMVDPVIIGAGTSVFQGLPAQLTLKLTSSKVFKSGVVLLCYEPA